MDCSCRTSSEEPLARRMSFPSGALLRPIAPDVDEGFPRPALASPPHDTLRRGSRWQINAPSSFVREHKRRCWRVDT
jgi:hypothetical protein